MSRKRKRTRRLQMAPLLLAGALIAIVVWAILPRTSRHTATHPAHPETQAETSQATIQPVTPAPSPTTESTAAALPIATPVLSPSGAPSATPTTITAATAARVAIIIDDCGQWPDTERGYLQLPIPLTLAVLPHVPYTAQIAQEAANAGKGVMLHLPMEPLSHRIAGRGEIETSMTDDEVTKQAEDDVAQVPLAQGFNNHEGSEASADARVMKDVIAVAKVHNLFFIDSRTSAKTVGASEATADGVPTASRDVFLDNRADVTYTESMLERTIAIAEQKGSAIAIGHPKPTTLEALREMYPRMEASGVEFVFARDLVR